MVTGLAVMADGTTKFLRVKVDERTFREICREVGDDAFRHGLNGDYQWSNGSVAQKESDAFMDHLGLHFAKSLPFGPQQPDMFEDIPVQLSRDKPKVMRTREEIVRRVSKDPVATAFCEWLFGPFTIEEIAYMERVALPAQERCRRPT